MSDAEGPKRFIETARKRARRTVQMQTQAGVAHETGRLERNFARL
jgi:hypothetical protein